MYSQTLILCQRGEHAIVTTLICGWLSRCICESKYFCANYRHPGEGLGRDGSWRGMRGVTGEHLEGTCRRHPGPPASSLGDWDTDMIGISGETRGTWPLAVPQLPVTCRHVLCVIGTLWCVNNYWPGHRGCLGTWDGRDLLNSQSGSWEKRKVCFNLLLHLHFDICGQFRFRFWQMSVPGQQRIVCFL